jgi:prophage regulatory protein
MNPYLLDRGDLKRRGIKIANSTLLRLEASGSFPKRVRIGGQKVAWIAQEIEEYVHALADAREDVR